MPGDMRKLAFVTFPKGPSAVGSSLSLSLSLAVNIPVPCALLQLSIREVLPNHQNNHSSRVRSPSSSTNNCCSNLPQVGRDCTSQQASPTRKTLVEPRYQKGMSSDAVNPISAHTPERDTPPCNMSLWKMSYLPPETVVPLARVPSTSIFGHYSHNRQLFLGFHLSARNPVDQFQFTLLGFYRYSTRM